jgi:RNA polymerase sigma factor (sigma-70 family)
MGVPCDGWIVRLDALDDARLLDALGSSPEAFGVLYRRYERPLLGFLVRRTGQAELAADLAAETFAAALEALRRDRGPDGAFAPWLFGIARNKLAESRRRGAVEDGARRRLAMEPVTLTDAALEEIDGLGQDASLVEVVAELSADQREAITARIVAEDDYASIAERLDVSEMVVRKRVSRGLATLRARIEESTR